MSKAILDMANMRETIEDNWETLHIHIPMQLKKRCGRKEIIVPGTGGSGIPVVNQPLVIGLARAHRWAEMLESGKVDSIGSLAKKVNVDIAYISRLLRLTLLAPDIIESILDGNEPGGLSLAKLLKEVPAVWENQRTTFMKDQSQSIFE
jgi:hypothetical protein